jgi:tartrate dehydrogenase/decarboxylase/D-malate dehydrogenase
VLKYAFELARQRERRNLTVGHEEQRHRHHHALLGRTRWPAMSGRISPRCRWTSFHIDILTARFVLQPQRFDVVVATNLFGDILSDLGPACTGTIGIAPSPT